MKEKQDGTGEDLKRGEGKESGNGGHNMEGGEVKENGNGGHSLEGEVKDKQHGN